MTAHTDHEIDQGDLLVLLGDKTGNFLYANPSYLEASGYAWEELKGTVAARMIHKDTPMDVLVDMAKTIRNGQQPWTGLIKNQRKNGQTYWLRLNISPLYANGQYAGSLMVHSKPTAAEVAEIAPVYKRLTSGDKTFVLRHGRPVRLTLWNRARMKVQTYGLKGHIWATIAMMAVIGVGSFSWALRTTAGSWAQWVALAAQVSAFAGGGLYLAKSIVDPLRRAMRMANGIAAGDLGSTLSSSRSDEIGGIMRALSQMNVNMRATVLDVRDGLSLMQRATAEIASGTSDLSARTESQASNLQQTAASMEEINTTVRNNSDTARQAAQVAASATNAAETGGKVVGEVISTMEGISKSSRQISEIIGVIDSIAFQTNILALNAAVEAARAGEQGRGFAVVAGEVRSLAQRSAQSAKEIRALIADSVDRVETGARLVSTAGSSIENLVTQVRRVTELVGEIANASHEQSSGIGQINQSVTQLDQMTQQNSALVEQSTASAESLAEQASRVAEAIGVFKLSAAENLALFNAAKGEQPAFHRAA
jgi:aerotaxis receptor